MVYKQANSYLQQITPVLDRHFDCLTRLWHLDDILSLPENSQKTIDNFSADFLFLQEVTRAFLKKCCEDMIGTTSLADEFFQRIKDCLTLQKKIAERADFSHMTGHAGINSYLWCLSTKLPLLRKQLNKGLDFCTTTLQQGNGKGYSGPFPTLPPGSANFAPFVPPVTPGSCMNALAYIPYAYTPPLQMHPLQTPEAGLLHSASGINTYEPFPGQPGPTFLPEENTQPPGADIHKVDKAQEELNSYLSKPLPEHDSRTILEFLSRIEEQLGNLPDKSKGKKNPQDTFKGRLYLMLKVGVHELFLEKYSKKAVYRILAEFCVGNIDDCSKYVRCYISEEKELNGTAPPEKVGPGQRERNMKYSMRGLYPEVDHRVELLEKSRKK